MYLWQRLAEPDWWNANEFRVRDEAGNDLAIIERPGRKRLVIEVSCKSRQRAGRLRRKFGGKVAKLPADWLKRFAQSQKGKPLYVGERLVITNVGGTSASRPRTRGRLSRRQGRSHIIIPAGAAFGTGQHSTTAMSLRLLEQLTRSWKPGWSMADLGTGSGIFALAAKTFGASRVIAIDIDPVAVITAKANARLNRISGIRFQVANVLKWRPPKDVNVVTANLFSELLIDVLPKLRRIPCLILSGVMRDQEREVVRALTQLGPQIVKTRRRGKWIAMLATGARRHSAT